MRVFNLCAASFFFRFLRDVSVPNFLFCFLFLFSLPLCLLAFPFPGFLCLLAFLARNHLNFCPFLAVFVAHFMPRGEYSLPNIYS